jgi:probable lipoprotein (TIGR04455 family)
VRSLSAPLIAALLAGCGPVGRRWVRPDYAELDRTRTVRLALVVSPLPAGDAAVGDLWAGIARAYVNLHRDFIVNLDAAGSTRPDEACGDGRHGVLLLSPLAVAVDGGEVEASFVAQLVRCDDGAVVWLAEGAGRFESEDDALVGQREHWVAELGPAVAPHVAPAYRLLTETLAALPEPAFPDDDLAREKIELGE